MAHVLAPTERAVPQIEETYDGTLTAELRSVARGVPSPGRDRQSPSPELHVAMALELKYGSDATMLLDDLVDSLGRPGSAAGVVVPVLMPSLPLVDRTKVALARRHGIAMGVAFLLPGAFIEHMARLVGLDPVHPSWRPEGLAWRLVPLLAAMAEDGHTPRLAAACVDARARQVLAGEVADRFDQYLYFRPEMIAAWDRGEAWDALPESAQGDENWQRDLWRRLSEGLADHANPAVRLHDLVVRIQAGDGKLPTSLEVLAHGGLTSDPLAAVARLGDQNPRLPTRFSSIDRIPRRPSCRSHADAGRPGRGPRPGRPPPAVSSGQASRR